MEGDNFSPRKLLAKREVAEILGVSERTVERIVDAGGLPVISSGGIGRCVRFDPADVEAWIIANKAMRAVAPALKLAPAVESRAGLNAPDPDKHALKLAPALVTRRDFKVPAEGK